MSRERLTRTELKRLVELRLRDQLGCRDAQVVVRSADENGVNWKAELAGLPAPHHCREAVDAISSELRAKYQLAKDKVSGAEAAGLLVSEALAELGSGWSGRPPPTPVIQVLPFGIGVPNWTAVPGGPVPLEYMQAFSRALARLQRHLDVFA